MATNSASDVALWADGAADSAAAAGNTAATLATRRTNSATDRRKGPDASSSGPPDGPQLASRPTHGPRQRCRRGRDGLEPLFNVTRQKAGDLKRVSLPSQ